MVATRAVGPVRPASVPATPATRKSPAAQPHDDVQAYPAAAHHAPACSATISAVKAPLCCPASCGSIPDPPPYMPASRNIGPNANHTAAGAGPGDAGESRTDHRKTAHRKRAQSATAASQGSGPPRQTRSTRSRARWRIDAAARPPVSPAGTHAPLVVRAQP